MGTVVPPGASGSKRRVAGATLSHMSVHADNRDWRLFLARACRRRCPLCGEGPLFRSKFRLAERCTHCSMVFRREAGGMTGQMYLSAAVTEVLAAILVLAVFFLTDWSPWTSILVCVPLVALFCYWSLPFFMGVWVVIELMTDIVNREPWLEELERREGREG